MHWQAEHDMLACSAKLAGRAVVIVASGNHPPMRLAHKVLGDWVIVR
jgi:hypothetical protein